MRFVRRAHSGPLVRNALFAMHLPLTSVKLHCLTRVRWPPCVQVDAVRLRLLRSSDGAELVCFALGGVSARQRTLARHGNVTVM